MILEAVYPSIDQATRNRLAKYLGPTGRHLAKTLLTPMQCRLGVTAEQLRPLDHIANVGAPVLIINGGADRNTTPADAALLFAKAREPKELWIIEGAGHVDLHAAAAAEYEHRVLGFIQRSRGAGGAPASHVRRDAQPM
jgi:alpha-beta hydrolase superfamily lysophospholipase